MRPTVLLALSVLLVSGFGGCLGAGNATAVKNEPATAKKLGGGLAHGLPSPTCDYKFDGRFSQVCAVGQFKETPFIHKILKSSQDGADIETGYWMPDGAPAGSKFPVIIMASPYYGNQGPVMALKSGYLLMLITNYVQHGYVVGGISVRGTGGSGGCMDLMGQKEIKDLDQAVTWFGEQPWSNGNVGLVGLSYDGSTPWSAAATGNPHVKTIVPISGVPDVYGLMFKNGSAESRGPFLLNALYYSFAVRDGGATGDPTQEEKAPEGLVCPDSWEGLGAAVYSGAVGARDPTGWWAERNRKPLVDKNYKGSILAVQGLQDWNVDPSMVIPWLDQLNHTQGLFVHQFLSQGNHNYPDTQSISGGKAKRWDWAQILLNWFDYWLKDEKTVQLGPSVQVEDNTFQWRYEDNFPPHDANWTTFWLADGNKLSPEHNGNAGSVLLTPAGAAGEPPAGLRAAPGFLADFTTAPVTKDTRISGLPKLHVTVTPTGPTGHLAAWLYDTTAGGQMKVIGETQMNLMFADGSETMKPLSPNQPVVAMMEFQPLDAVVPAGDRITVRVWENADQDRIPSIPPESVSLNYGPSVSSSLSLPIIERGQDVLFNPPFPAK